MSSAWQRASSSIISIWRVRLSLWGHSRHRMSEMVSALFGVNALLNAATYVDGFVDANWAVPMNTALLILLAIVNYALARRTQRDTDDAKRQAEDAKRAVGATRREEDPG